MGALVFGLGGEGLLGCRMGRVFLRLGLNGFCASIFLSQEGCSGNVGWRFLPRTCTNAAASGRWRVEASLDGKWEGLMFRFGCILFALGFGLSACGSTQGDRAVSGAGIGAASGAIVGAVTGLTVAQGAVIGALGGALLGVISDEEKLNLGEPIWKRSSHSSAGQSSHSHYRVSDPQLVTKLQSGMVELGIDPGPVDGIMGPMTARAIRKYQKEHNLLTDGQPSWELAQHIDQQVR